MKIENRRHVSISNKTNEQERTSAKIHFTFVNIMKLHIMGGKKKSMNKKGIKEKNPFLKKKEIQAYCLTTGRGRPLLSYKLMRNDESHGREN